MLWCFVFFETLFQIAQRLEAVAFVFPNPPLVDLVQRRRIEVMQFFTSVPESGDEVRRFQQRQMLGHGLARHVQVAAQLAQRLPVVAAQLVQQLSTAFVRQGLEYCIHLA